MIKIHGLRKKISIQPIPIIKNEKLYPAGLEFGKSLSIEGRLAIEGEYGEIILAEKLHNISDIQTWIKKGTKAIILKYPVSMEVKIFPKSILLFYTNTEDYELLNNYIGKYLKINFSLKNYFTTKCKSFYITYAKTFQQINISRFICNSYYRLCRQLEGYFELNRKEFHIYCLSDDDFNNKYAFLDAEYTYKDFFIVLNCFDKDGYLKNRVSSEVHEMTHILLSKYNRPVFLFKEGVPCLMSFILSNEMDITSCLLKGDEYKKVNFKNMLCDQNMHFNSDEYYDASLIFLYKIYKVAGVYPIAKAFKCINCENTPIDNLLLFEEILGKYINEPL
jgi:hypothetical protein